MIHKMIFLLVLALASDLFQIGQSFGELATVGSLWTQWIDGNNAQLGGVPGTYALCILQAGKLTPQCGGPFVRNNDTLAPSSQAFYGIGSGDSFTCGLLYGTMFPACWGTRPDSNSSVPDNLRGVRYSSMSVGGFHVCTLTGGGDVDCWGGNSSGQAQPPRSVRFASLASGMSFSCGLNTNDAAVCWGASSLAPLTPGTSSFEAIFAGGFHACGIEKMTRRTICWGDRTYNQSSPPEASSFRSMALGLYHSCGIRSDNLRVVCWGDDRYSQVSSRPVDEPFSSINAGDLYTCGLSLRDLGTVKCWGNSLTNFSVFNSTKVSQGLCTSAPCSSQQFELGTGGQCPNAGDRICLECPTQCGAIELEDARNCSCSRIVPPRPSSRLGIILGCSLAGAAVLLGLLATGCYFIRVRNKPVLRKRPVQWHRLVAYSRSQIEFATRNFADDMIFGRGAQGIVYKGVFPDGQVVAVKKQANAESLEPELDLLGRLHHTCLVNLIGYCYEGSIFVYEFMENDSLYHCLFKRPDLSLDLSTRIRIATQAARGLEYLHTYASPRIIHRDVKSANILLDRDWNAHVSDFGLSTFGPHKADATHLSSVTVVGTPGYLDPEYFKTGQLSSKSDVYSFGMVLLELLCRRKCGQPEALLLEQLLDAGSLWRVKFLDEKLLDDDLDGTKKDKVDKLFELALECTRERGKDRPHMGEVATRLEATHFSLERSSSQEPSNSSGFNPSELNSDLQAR